jgi:hypothetical protein
MRPAARWANYPGDQTHMIGQHVGPTALGDWLTAVDAVFDQETNQTRVGFAFGLLEATS